MFGDKERAPCDDGIMKTSKDMPTINTFTEEVVISELYPHQRPDRASMLFVKGVEASEKATYVVSTPRRLGKSAAFAAFNHYAGLDRSGPAPDESVVWPPESSPSKGPPRISLKWWCDEELPPAFDVRTRSELAKRAFLDAIEWLDVDLVESITEYNKQLRSPCRFLTGDAKSWYEAVESAKAVLSEGLAFPKELKCYINVIGERVIIMAEGDKKPDYSGRGKSQDAPATPDLSPAANARRTMDDALAGRLSRAAVAELRDALVRSDQNEAVRRAARRMPGNALVRR